MRNILGTYILSLFLIYSLSISSQVMVRNLKTHVKTLSCAEMEGRGLNTVGIYKAQYYILNHLNDLNIGSGNGNSYNQNFVVLNRQPFEVEKDYIIVSKDTIYEERDYLYLKSNSLVYDTLDLLSPENLEGKIESEHINSMLIQDIENLNLSFLEKYNVEYVFTTINDSITFNKMKRININGFISKNSDKKLFIVPSENYSIIYLHPRVYSKMSNLVSNHNQTEERLKVIMKIHQKKNIYNATNVLGFIPGEIGDSTIVISAHYDHIGVKKDKIFYGANDNASGTAALMEVARVLQDFSNSHKKPRCNIMFAFFSAEEIGLVGSHFFVNHTAYPINKTLANINMDMIGSADPEHKDIDDFIYAFGPLNTSENLMLKAKEINQLHNFVNLDFFDNNPAVGSKFLRYSDQKSFIEKDVPVLFFFNGLSPNYHRVTDTYEKLDYEKMKNVCDLVIELVKDLAFDL